MLLIDDILMMPAKGLFWIFRQIDKAAQDALNDEAGSLRARLSDAYMALETGRITEEEFAEEEKKLLDRLDRLEGVDELEASDEQALVDGQEKQVKKKVMPSQSRRSSSRPKAS
ncbi:MAG: gas vesicle protein GvpG [Acidobacteriia bacterium]|nr:gas vesicle protein GvpG [Terriglobia bacterium]